MAPAGLPRKARAQDGHQQLGHAAAPRRRRRLDRGQLGSNGVQANTYRAEVRALFRQAERAGPPPQGTLLEMQAKRSPETPDPRRSNRRDHAGVVERHRRDLEAVEPGHERVEQPDHPPSVARQVVQAEHEDGQRSAREQARPQRQGALEVEGLVDEAVDEALQRARVGAARLDGERLVAELIDASALGQHAQAMPQQRRLDQRSQPRADPDQVARGGPDLRLRVWLAKAKDMDLRDGARHAFQRQVDALGTVEAEPGPRGRGYSPVPEG